MEKRGKEWAHSKKQVEQERDGSHRKSEGGQEKKAIKHTSSSHLRTALCSNVNAMLHKCQ